MFWPIFWLGSCLGWSAGIFALGGVGFTPLGALGVLLAAPVGSFLGLMILQLFKVDLD